jgi:DNA-binding GntR family transcriptional regulator
MSDEAYQRIRDKILKGELALGAAISRRRLAEEFGMSFLPISEAIRRLEQDGLVESRFRVGTRVRIPSARDLRDRLIMREALEVQCARLFAEKASADERLELRSMAAHTDTMALAAAGGDRDEEFFFRLQRYHLSLHMRIAECTGCAALLEALEKNQVLIFNWLYDTAAHHRMPPGSHRPLAEAVSGNDPGIAEAAMRQHVRYGMQEIHAEIASRFFPGAVAFPEVKARRSKSSAGANWGAWRVKSGTA